MKGNRSEAALIKRIVFGFVLIVLASSLAGKGLGSIVLVPLFLGYILYLMWWDVKNSGFICANCKKTFRVELWQYVTGFRLSLSATRQRLYLRCPHCAERSWATQNRDAG